MSLPRTVVTISALLLVAQAVVLGVTSQPVLRAGVSGLLQLGIGLVLVVAAAGTARTPGASPFERRFLQLLAARYVIWAAAQGLATSYEFAGRTDFEGSLADVLFHFEDVALGIALCLDPGRSDRAERPHLLDLGQIVVFWAAVYAYIRLLTQGEQGLFPNWEALVAASFYLRAMMSRSLAASAMFGRWTPVLLLSSANHAYAGFYGSVAGSVFDLVWSVDMVLWIVTAVTWKPGPARDRKGRPSAADRTVRHLPLVVACFSLVLAVGIAQRRLGLAALLVVAALGCSVGRLLVRRARPHPA